MIEEYADYLLEAGFQYPERHISISAAEQHRLHGWCDMAPEVFGEVADPSLVGRLPVVMIAKREAARGYEHLLTKRCTPEATVGYCQGSNNPIHSDVTVAQQFGFRAPILAGTQTMSFLLEPLYRHYAPQAFSLTIRFMRPAFWDDVLTM